MKNKDKDKNIYKYLFFICFILLLLVLFYYNQEIVKQEPVQKLDNTTISTTDSNDFNNIANDLFTDYLSKNIDKNVEKRRQLTDFKININKIVSHKDDDGFCFEVNYSVKPLDIENTNWVAGNGDINQNTGWVENKQGYVEISKLDGEYMMKGVATGPPCL